MYVFAGHLSMVKHTTFKRKPVAFFCLLCVDVEKEKVCGQKHLVS